METTKPANKAQKGPPFRLGAVAEKKILSEQRSSGKGNSKLRLTGKSVVCRLWGVLAVQQAVWYGSVKDPRRFLATGKECRVHLRQCACSRECALVSVLVAVLLISVYGCFAGQNLFESGRVCSLFRRRQNSGASFLGRLCRRAPKWLTDSIWPVLTFRLCQNGSFSVAEMLASNFRKLLVAS